MANIVNLYNEVVFDADVVSVQTGYAATPLDDGYVCKLAGLVTGERDLYTVTAPADITADDVVIVVGAEVYIDADGFRVPKHNKTKWTYAGDRPVRAYRPRTGMRFLISNTAISGTAVKDQYIVTQNSDFGLAASSTVGSGRVVLKVEEVNASIPVGKSLVTGAIARVVKGL